MLIRVFCVAEQASSRGVLEGGGGGGGATGLLNKGGGKQQASWFSKQAVEFPQVQTSLYIIVFAHSTVCNDQRAGPN